MRTHVSSHTLWITHPLCSLQHTADVLAHCIRIGIVFAHFTFDVGFTIRQSVLLSSSVAETNDSESRAWPDEKKKKITVTSVCVDWRSNQQVWHIFPVWPIQPITDNQDLQEKGETVPVRTRQPFGPGRVYKQDNSRLYFVVDLV